MIFSVAVRFFDYIFAAGLPWLVGARGPPDPIFFLNRLCPPKKPKLLDDPKIEAVWLAWLSWLAGAWGGRRLGGLGGLDRLGFAVCWQARGRYGASSRAQ